MVVQSLMYWQLLCLHYLHLCMSNEIQLFVICQSEESTTHQIQECVCVCTTMSVDVFD